MDDKRVRLLDSALALFAERGFHGTPVPQIASLAGVATGTVYRYFASKEILANELYRHWRGVFNARVLAPMGGQLTPEQQFQIYWGRLTDWVRNERLAALFVDGQRHGDYLDGQSKAVARIYPSAARAFVRAGIASGALRPAPPDALVAVIWGSVLGLLKLDDGSPSNQKSQLSPETMNAAGKAVWFAIAARAR